MCVKATEKKIYNKLPIFNQEDFKFNYSKNIRKHVSMAILLGFPKFIIKYKIIQCAFIF